LKPRYKERISVHFPVIFTIGSRLGEGVVLDLTIPGCLIQSPIALKKGEYLHLKMFLPRMKLPFSVALGAVRWDKGTHFGVEFIKMSEKDSRVLTQFMSQQLAGKSWHQTLVRPATSFMAGESGNAGDILGTDSGKPAEKETATHGETL
jgi:hypothetical protein